MIPKWIARLDGAARMLWIACSFVSLVGCVTSLPSGGPPAGPTTARPPSLLVVDFGMAEPDVHRGMLEQSARVGYRADYRSSYPKLVRRDFDDYDAIMLLAGGTPDYPGGMMSASALGPLTAYVRAGHVLMLGTRSNPRHDELGENERTLFNALLRRLSVPVVIAKGRVWDEEEQYANTLFDAPWLFPNPQHPVTAGLPERMQWPSAAALTAGPDVAVLLHASPTSRVGNHDDEPSGVRLPVAAMARSGKGLVVVAPRSFFHPTGAYQVETPLLPAPQYHTARRLFVERLTAYTIDWLRGTAVWQPAMVGEQPAVRESPARPPFWRSTRLPSSVPEGIERVSVDPPGTPPARADRVAWLRSLGPRFQWIRDEGIRAGWTYVDRDADFQQAVVRAADAAQLNLLWGATDAEMIAQPGLRQETEELLTQWRRMDRLLDGRGLRWFMGSHFPGWRAKLADYPPVLGAQGQQIDGMSPIDWVFWWREIFPVVRAEAEFSRTHRSVAGLLIDLEMYQLKYWYLNNGFDFGDVAFRRYLQALSERGMTVRMKAATAVDPDERFDWLMERGLLDDYYAVLGREAERIGRRLREEIRRINPELSLGFYTVVVPTGWFYEGLLRGATASDDPALLFTFQHAPEEELVQAQRKGIYLLHAGAILLGQVGTAQIRDVVHARLAEESGYWVNNIATLAVEDPDQHRRSRIESPRDGTAEDYLRALAAANRSFDRRD